MEEVAVAAHSIRAQVQVVQVAVVQVLAGHRLVLKEHPER